jgi:flagellar protein FliL
MSAAIADAAPAHKRRLKKPLLIAAALLALLLIGVASAFAYSRMQATPDEDDFLDAAPARGHAALRKPAKIGPPVFVPLETFTVNLADRQAERYAQVGVTLELDSAESAEAIKAYLPAVRNNVLMLLSHKRAEQLLERPGKELLGREIAREVVRPMGLDLPEVGEEDSPEAQQRRQRQGRRVPVHNPVVQVHFSSFIIQ